MIGFNEIDFKDNEKKIFISDISGFVPRLAFRFDEFDSLFTK